MRYLVLVLVLLSLVNFADSAVAPGTTRCTRDIGGYECTYVGFEDGEACYMTWREDHERNFEYYISRTCISTENLE